jgi:hypothetical protein
LQIPAYVRFGPKATERLLIFKRREGPIATELPRRIEMTRGAKSRQVGGLVNVAGSGIEQGGLTIVTIVIIV